MTRSPSAASSRDHYDVVIVGAGISGVDTAWRLQQRRPDTTYLILEARHEIGGTWDLFRYPGIRSDSDIATFAFPFRPWPGEHVLAEGEQIQAYVEQTAAEAGITAQIRFGTRVEELRWSSHEQRWTVSAASEAGPVTVTCAFVHLAAGYYDYARGYQPDFAGRNEFDGVFVHPQAWPEQLDVTGRRVVVIGSGATAMTMVPALARSAAHVTMLQRSPSWVASMPNRDPWAQRFNRWLPPAAAHRATRAVNILLSQATYTLARRRPEQFARTLRATLRRDLPDEEYLDAHFTPDYPPWDQRVCRIPNGDLMRAVAEGRAEVVTSTINTLVGEGVRLEGGRVLDADVIVSATGLSLLLLGGIAVTVDGEEVDPASRVAYRGLMLERVPNLTFTVGYVNASWTLRSDLVARYLCRLLSTMDRRGYAVATPTAAPPGPRRPLIDLKAGYVLRALDQLPRLGPRRPWTFAQNYLVEAPELLYGRLGRDLVFTPRSTALTKGTAMSPPRLAPLRYSGGTAVVTGAAGGIGEQLAHQLAASGSHLALVDRKAEPLHDLAAHLRTRYPGLRVSAHCVDLADPTVVEELAEDVLHHHDDITVLVNNAGVALAGTFEQLSTTDVDWLLRINLHAPIALTKAFLPALTHHPGSHIINVSSLFGLVAPAGQTAYATSKFGLRGFSEALRSELAEHSVGVTSVHPGGVATRIAADSRTGADLDEAEAQAGREAFGRLLTMDPAAAAGLILEGARRRRARVLVGPTSVVLDLVERLAPTRGGRILTAAATRQAMRRPRHGVARRPPQVTPSPGPKDGAYAGPGVSTVTAAGTEVRVRVTGPDHPAGGTALLLHGIGRSLQDWNEQHRRLSARHRVISLDLPGFGFTPRSPAGMGLDSLADAAVATMDALGESAPVHLVGNSLGGAVAMTVLARHPERVRTITLASSAGFGAKASLDLRLLAVPGLGPWLLRRPSRSATARVERTLYADPAVATPERIDHAVRLAWVPGRAEAFREALLSVGSVRRVRPTWRRSLLKRLREHPVPTLVVWGQEDTVLPAEQIHSAAEALPHARTVLLAEAGHLPQLERPDRFAAEVLRLWGEAGKAGPRSSSD